MIVIVDYGVGNLGSIANMLRKVGATAVVSSELAAVETAEKLILPGVGAFDHGMRRLLDSGLLPALSNKVLRQGVPLLGICVGMQLITNGSEEGNLPGLGWIDAQTMRFKIEKADRSLKVPHMGWNSVTIKRPSKLFDGMDQEPRFYFVHSYHVHCNNPADVVATTAYGYEFHSAVSKGNIMGTQFHPEKSHKFGMKILKNFSEM